MLNKYNNLILVLFILAFAAIPALASAETLHNNEPQVRNELWLTTGFYSYHFQQDQTLNNHNWGVGLEYRYSNINSVTAGRFQNSDLQMSDYVAWFWQPCAWGPLRLGGLLGAIDGYPKMSNGAWFPMLLPVASLEYQRVGINLTIIPNIQDRLHGSISLQFKFKLYE
jgi:hypothetical protein